MQGLRRLQFKPVIYLIFLLLSLILVSSANAFEISPVKSLFTINPGNSQTVAVKIKNTPPSIPPLKGEGQGVGFKLNVLGMSQDETGSPIFSRGADVAENWVYPENSLVNIKSGEIKSVNFFIKIPADALAGSHYLGLSVEPVLEKTGVASLSTRLVSLLTLQVKGLVDESVQIEKWEPIVGVTGERNWKFDLGFKNNGTIEVLMKGAVAIRNWRGEEIFSEPVILGNKLLAGSKRVLHPEIILKNTKVFSSFTQENKQVSSPFIQLENNISLPGLYSAQIKINYGLTNQNVSSIAYIWYFPKWSKIVSGAIGLLFVALVLLLVKKRRKKY